MKILILLLFLADFSDGEGYYKLHLNYLNKNQVEEIEEMIKTWNKDENLIKACIGMCLTDIHEQRFKDFNVTLKDCLAWLEKQGKVKHTCRNCQTFQNMHQNCPYSPIYQYSDLKKSHKHLDDETYCVFWSEKQDKYLEDKNEQKNKINSYKIAVEITYEDILVLECSMKTINLTGWDGANELYEKIVSLYNKIHNAYLLQLQDEQDAFI